MRQKLFSFIIILTVWFIFAGKVTIDVAIVGTIAALLATYLFGDMLLRTSNHKLNPVNVIRRIILVIFFIPVFFYEALVSAVNVSRYVFKRNPTFTPGIVKVKTKLTNVSAITILANLITLTPGTLTLDFDKTERVYYIHWINVKTREEAEAKKEIIEKFEGWLDVIFK
ncbi:MAG: Na+/H+ antiporter subunit E [Halothermotrichaceae bacterium]